MDHQSGDFRQRITIQVRQETTAEANIVGDEVVNWNPVGNYWAEVEPLSGRQLFNAQQVKATIDYRVSMRQAGPLAPLDNRFVYRGLVLNIESVTRDQERNAYYTILCTSMKGETP